MERNTQRGVDANQSRLPFLQNSCTTSRVRHLDANSPALPQRTTRTVAKLCGTALRSAVLYSVASLSTLAVQPFLGNVNEVHAQSSSASTIRFLHQPLDEASLGMPEGDLRVTVELEGSQDFTQRVDVLAVKDGRLLETRMNEATLNEFDRPQFAVVIPSPNQSLKYQFLLRRPDGTVLVSRLYSVERSCTPDISLYSSAQLDPPKGSTVLENMFYQSRKLEHELGLYQQIQTLVGDIQGMLPKGAAR